MMTMKSLLKMTWMEAKLFLREPVGAFFTLVFPLIMLFIFGTVYSNVPTGPGSGGPDAIGSLIPAFMAMVIGITGLMAVTITMATYRENGILRRLRTTPVSPLVVMVAQVAVVFTMTCPGHAPAGCCREAGLPRALRGQHPSAWWADSSWAA